MALFHLLFRSFGQTSCQTDDLSSNAGWTQVGTDVMVSGGKLLFDDSYTGADNRVYKSVPNYDLFRLDFSFKPTAEFSPAHILMSYSKGSEQSEATGVIQARSFISPALQVANPSCCSV